MMGSLSNFSSMSLSDRGRSASHSRTATNPNDRSTSRTRTRSVSPFFRRRRRDPSPRVEALAISDAESDTDSLASSKLPRNSAFTLNDDSASEGDGSETDISDESSTEADAFDKVTEMNTERNAQTFPEAAAAAEEADVDPLGEGVNVVVPPEPLFPTTLHGAFGNRRGSTLTKRKTLRMEHLPLNTSLPIFQRDRCTIRLTNGDPATSVEALKRRARRYVVASDMSVESRYAVEWCIGTVMGDGDEMIVVNVTEAEGKRKTHLTPSSGRYSD
jgi:hypothetical protein